MTPRDRDPAEIDRLNREDHCGPYAPAAPGSARARDPAVWAAAYGAAFVHLYAKEHSATDVQPGFMSRRAVALERVHAPAAVEIADAAVSALHPEALKPPLPLPLPLSLPLSPYADPAAPVVLSRQGPEERDGQPVKLAPLEPAPSVCDPTASGKECKPPRPFVPGEIPRLAPHEMGLLAPFLKGAPPYVWHPCAPSRS
jgi:hypothetical protein